MTTAELEELVGERLDSKKVAVVMFGERTFWKQSDGTWVDYDEERRERRERHRL